MRTVEYRHLVRKNLGNYSHSEGSAVIVAEDGESIGEADMAGLARTLQGVLDGRTVSREDAKRITVATDGEIVPIPNGSPTENEVENELTHPTWWLKRLGVIGEANSGKACRELILKAAETPPWKTEDQRQQWIGLLASHVEALHAAGKFKEGILDKINELIDSKLGKVEEIPF